MALADEGQRRTGAPGGSSAWRPRPALSRRAAAKRGRTVMATTVELRCPGMATRAIQWATALLVLSARVVGGTIEEFPAALGATWRCRCTPTSASWCSASRRCASPGVRWRHHSRLKGAAWQRLAAVAMHIALIGLTIGVPLSGPLDRWARGRAVTVFGGVPLPARSRCLRGASGARRMRCWPT